jgi:hypothetical protein
MKACTMAQISSRLRHNSLPSGLTRGTGAVRRAIQNSQESLRSLAKRHGINPKTVAKWKMLPTISDMPTGPKNPKSTVLTVEEEAIIVAFRKHTLLPPDNCLYALQATLSHLTRSSLHRCLQRQGISRLPDVEGDKTDKKKFKSYPIGCFHHIAEVQTAEGRLYLYVVIDRTSKFAFVQFVKRTGKGSIPEPSRQTSPHFDEAPRTVGATFKRVLHVDELIERVGKRSCSPVSRHSRSVMRDPPAIPVTLTENTPNPHFSNHRF